MRKDIISNLALKRMCYILLRTRIEWWLNIGDISNWHKVHNIWSKKKGKSKEKIGEKRKFAACENRTKRACLIFRSLGGALLVEIFEPDSFGTPQLETTDCETLRLVITSKTDKASLRDLCRANWPRWVILRVILIRAPLILTLFLLNAPPPPSPIWSPPPLDNYCTVPFLRLSGVRLQQLRKN